MRIRFAALITGCFILIACTGISKKPEHTVTLAKGDVNFIVIGDWGNYGKERQHSVAKQMNILAGQQPVDFIVSTGDNIYDVGVQSVNDPLWQKAFEDVYSLEHIKELDWYVVLGNHDYQGNSRAQLEYSQVNQDWKLPGTYHSLQVDFGDHDQAVLVFSDTNPYKKGYQKNPDKYLFIDEQDTELQSRWLSNILSAYQNAEWRIVVGHHPIYSSGKHGGTFELVESFVPLLEKHNVNAYFSGHEHDLQHQKPPGKVHYFVSGAGAKLREAGSNQHTLFSKSVYGFAYVTISGESMRVEFIDVNGEIVYSTKISNK